MSLTSTGFEVAVIVAAAIVALATTLLWNRVGGPRAVRIASRVLLVVLGEALATLALLVAINIGYGGLIVSWADLLGNQSTHGGGFTGTPGQWRAHARDITASQAARVVSGRQLFTPAGYGGFEKTTLRGRSSGITSDVWVWTPPEYREHPDEQFPVLELFHGIWGGPTGWTGPMRVVDHLEAAMKTGAVHPFILVVPNIAPIAGHGSPWNNEECADVPGDAKVDTWLTSDVRQMVLDNFRAIEPANGWGMMGYSTGGFCAASLVLRHPDQYRAAVSLSGYYVPESRLLLADKALARSVSPLWVIGHEATPDVSLLMTSSAQDKLDPPSEGQQMIDAAKANPRAAPTEVQAFVAPLGGGHNQSAWEKMLPTSFTWLSQRLSKPVR